MKKIHYILLFAALWSMAAAPLALRAHKLRIMTFNIRLHTKADAPLNMWEDRRDAACAYVKKVNPDIFGMQEVKKDQLDDVVNRLPGYSYVGVGRDDGKDAGEHMPVFYRTDKYNLIDKGWFWLSETPNEPSFGWNAACRRIATWVILEEKKSKVRFFYCNTHFDHISVTARKESAKLTKDKFKELAGNLPTFFTADFNTNEKEETYSLLCNYSYPYNDAWHVAKKREGGPATFNGWGKVRNVEDKKIDFIFLSPGIQVKKAVIHDSSLGGGRYLSDHNAHWADVTWK
ncbi:MAG: endonuclease/exonuclease/phosphatase family protein [Bacteroidaceae bacterium]|nr:endonuclease/exonuclease/phosphatase family protein [Bacteroidaceae bacterium]